MFPSSFKVCNDFSCYCFVFFVICLMSSLRSAARSTVCVHLQKEKKERILSSFLKQSDKKDPVHVQTDEYRAASDGSHLIKNKAQSHKTLTALALLT